MSQVIDVPGQGPVEFPDDMNDEQIVAAIKRTQLQAPNAEQRRMGIRQPRAKDERFAQNVGHAVESAPYDIGGGVTDLGAKMRLPPEISAGAGYLANLATEAVPMAIGGGAAAATKAPALIESAGKQLMQSALKPTWEALRTGKAAKAIDTMLEEGVNVTPGGVMKLRSKIGELNQQISDAIANSVATVDKTKVTNTLHGLLDEFKNQVTPNADMAAVRKAWQQFFDHPLLQNLQDIPVQLAQKLKQGTYKSLGSKSYGELKGAETEAQKTLARGLKEEIASVEPAVGPLNAAESKLLNAHDIAERRVLVDANKNPMGLGWLAAHPSTWLGFAADRSPLVKSLLARLLYSQSEAIPASAGRGIGAIIGAQGQE